MEIALILIGIVTLVAAVRGTHQQFFALIKNDFTGPNNFVIWLAALFAIGGLGYIKPIKPIATALLALVIIVMILAQQKNGSGGFFEMLKRQIEETQAPQAGLEKPTDLEGNAISVDSFVNQFLKGTN